MTRGVCVIAAMVDPELWRTLTFQGGYNTSVVMAATMLLGAAAGVIGTFALLRKRSLVADAVSHATLPGICIAFIIVASLGGPARSLPVLLLGATGSSIIGVLTIHAIVRYTRLREDAAIGIVLSVFFGIGVVLLSLIQTMQTGQQAGLKTYIYGQAAAMNRGDAILLAGIAAMAVVVAGLLLKELRVVCFDQDFAAVNGWPVQTLDLMMMSLIVVVTVAGLQAVGLILVVAMLIIPPASARFWTDRMGLVVVLSALMGATSGYVGTAISAMAPKAPAGAVIVLTGGAIFLLSLVCAPRRGVGAGFVRWLRLRLRMAADHAVEALYERERARASTPGGFATAAHVRGWSRVESWLVMIALVLRGFVTRREGVIALTQAGRERGQRIERNHRLWEQYLITRADVAPSHVDWSVDQVEHVLSPRIIAELERTLAVEDERSRSAADRAEAQA